MVTDKIRKNGELHKGYIVGMKLLDYYDLCVDVYYDGIFNSVFDNDAADLYENFNNRYEVNGNDVIVKGIPVDIYSYKNKIYLDLDSIKKEDLQYEIKVQVCLLC